MRALDVVVLGIVFLAAIAMVLVVLTVRQQNRTIATQNKTISTQNDTIASLRREVQARRVRRER